MTSPKILLAVLIIGNSLCLYAGSNAALIKFTSPVVDLHVLSDGNVRLYTQRLDIYDANASTGEWTKRKPTTGGALIRRVSQVLRSDSTVLAFGQMVTNDGAASVVLRSTDLGATFTPVLVGIDTLAITDGCSRAPDGGLNFIDRVGRLWSSSNDGVTWINKRLPRELTPGSVREIDMIDANTGVCIDALRNIHFTTDGWATQITPLTAKRPILRTQPSMINNAGWIRNFVLLQNYLYLTEAGDVYRTASNDLIWERWDSVTTVAVSLDRKNLVYRTQSGKLVLQNATGSSWQVLDDHSLVPYILRIEGTTVIAYRPDTGPVIYNAGKKTSIRPLTSDNKITDPTLVTADGKWGIYTNTINAVDVDIVRKDGKGQWYRDTVLRVGPVRSIYTTGADSLVLKTGVTSNVYTTTNRTVSPYVVTKPLGQFLEHPVVRFRILYASDELDSTHVTWVEYVTQGDDLVCAELVDSSKFGVKSQLVTNRIKRSDVRNLLAEINDRGEALPGADFISLDAAVIADFYGILDTIFSRDAYFDQYDMYMPPPMPEQQARECREKFAHIIEELPTIGNEGIAQSFQAFRHVPHDGHSRYVIEFQNRSGRIAVFTVDRTDEAHPPMMLPWRGYADGRTWHSYSTGLAKLFNTSLPSNTVPPMFKELSREAWFLVGVASYLDGIRYGRRHRWSNRIITPSARW